MEGYGQPWISRTAGRREAENVILVAMCRTGSAARKSVHADAGFHSLQVAESKLMR